MVKRGYHPIWSLFAAVVLLLLAVPGCNLRMGGEPEDETPTATLEASPLPEPVEIAYEPGIGSLVPWIDQSYLVFVPGGEFIMGKDEDMPSDHAPQHTVSVDSFWIHQTEVTNNQYALCVAAGVCLLPYRTTGLPFWYASPVRGLDPVVGVSWQQAATYCEWIEGRLPTEAEWEKAARGTEGDPYPWGEEEPTCSLLNFDGCQEIDQPVRVRTFLDGASPFLLADTAGNVAEWVGDWYDEEYYSTSPATNPTGPASGTNRVVRGSSYSDVAEDLAIYQRDSIHPAEHHGDVGFRCVVGCEMVGNPPPPVCEALPYVPAMPEEDYERFPPAYVPSAFCAPDPATGVSLGYVTFRFEEPVGPEILVSSSFGVLTTAISDDPRVIGVAGPGVPIETTFEITVCDASMPDFPTMEPVCPDLYYFDEESDTCRYGTPSMHDTPGSCNPTEIFVPGYGCLHAMEESGPPGFMCPMGFDIYHDYVSLDPPGTYRVCVPVDGPEECLTDPLCSASNTCLEGYSYITELDCCELPPDVVPYCPPPYTLKLTDESTCSLNEWSWVCNSFTAHIDSCDTCLHPETYTSQGACEAAFCRWIRPTQGPSYCTFP